VVRLHKQRLRVSPYRHNGPPTTASKNTNATARARRAEPLSIRGSPARFLRRRKNVSLRGPSNSCVVFALHGSTTVGSD
jgi:hypothetical protein